MTLPLRPRQNSAAPCEQRFSKTLMEPSSALENLRFSDEEIDWLARSGRFGKGLLDHLVELRLQAARVCRLGAAQAVRRQGDVAGTQTGLAAVWPDGRMAGDILSVEGDQQTGEPLIQLVMQGGRRVAPVSTGASYPVQGADTLKRLAAEVDSRFA